MCYVIKIYLGVFEVFQGAEMELMLTKHQGYDIINYINIETPGWPLSGLKKETG